MAKMKVYSWDSFVRGVQSRMICAATSQAAVAAIMGVKRITDICDTGNAQDPRYAELERSAPSLEG